MKHLSLIALLVVTLFATSLQTYAGVATRKALAATTRESNSPVSLQPGTMSAEKLVSMLHLPVSADGDHQKRPRDTSGWEGIVALCCGVLALFTGITAIPAIIFGALGMARGKKHRGMAIAGLVLGIVVVFVVAMVIVAFASIY